MRSVASTAFISAGVTVPMSLPIHVIDIGTFVLNGTALAEPTPAVSYEMLLSCFQVNHRMLQFCR